MVMIVAFNLLQLAVAGYALWRGGGPERAVALLLLAASLATIVTPATYRVSYFTVFYAVMWIDLALFLGLAAVAAFADRFWPMWLTALQLVALGAHGVRAIDPQLWAAAYWLVTTKIAYPMLLLLFVGTLRHRQRRAAGLPERSWSHAGRSDEALREGVASIR